MPFPKGDPRAVAAGRRAQAVRWAKSTQADRDASAANMRAKMRAGYIERATMQLVQLGVEPTDEQVSLAADLLHRADLRARLAKGRATLAATRAAHDADPWLQRVHKLATAQIDMLARETNAYPFDPERTREWTATIARVIYSGLRDEAELPVEQRSYDRLRRRWEDYRLYLHERTCRTRDMCDVCGIEKPA